MNTSEGPSMVKGLRASPPPFLIKTHQIVEDPYTNSIISWSSSGTSFIIWDHLIFSKDILGKYFKHKNFASFNYQLNNYGFKKIGLRQYEYENQLFQAGREDLLINITRRDQRASVTKRRRVQKQPHDAEMFVMEAELRNLRSNVDMMKLQVGSLRQIISDSEIHINQSEQHMREREAETQKLLEFLAKTCGSSFAQQMTQYLEEDKEREPDQEMEERGLGLQQRNEIPSNMNFPQKGVELESQMMQDPILEGVSTENLDAQITWKKFMEMREEDHLMCENESALQEKAQEKCNMHLELDDMMAYEMVGAVEDGFGKRPNIVVEDEVPFELWG